MARRVVAGGGRESETGESWIRRVLTWRYARSKGLNVCRFLLAAPGPYIIRSARYTSQLPDRIRRAWARLPRSATESLGLPSEGNRFS